MKKRGYEIILFITYVAMAATCMYLNFFTVTQRGNVANLIVNAAMFVIVGVILISAVMRNLLPASAMTADLIRVTEKIENDAKNSHRFLWEQYREEKEELFRSRILAKQYQDYRHEVERIARNDRTYYKCDIEDYVGLDLVDGVMHRERMNQVAGVMTGLGILGTFIGLSLGLQSFNTGTTAQIAGSIEPLMEGIKVAFHTSIYGMVFSLVFNYVYKRRLDDTENAVRDFVSAYRKYVMPDTASDGFNHMIALQRQQTDAILNFSHTMADQLSKDLDDILRPQFDRFDQTITGFADVATQNQMVQLSKIVNAFMAEMNRSLEHSFSRLAEKIDNTIALQEANEKQIKELYAKNLNVAAGAGDVAAQTQALVSAMRQYADEVLYLERETGNNLAQLREQHERTFKLIDANLHVVEDHFMDTIENVNNTISGLK